METLFYNGKIITMTAASGEEECASSPEAVLVRDGKIEAVGKLDMLSALAGKDVEKRNLEGKCLMPSFIDPHSHVIFNGQMSQWAQLADCGSFDDVVETLQAYAAEKEIGPGGVLLGFGYDHNALQEQAHPDRRVLDRVSTDYPIMILHTSVHLCCANSKALELGGITAQTPDPDGGRIDRFENGEPTGYLEEAAAWQGLFMKLVPTSEAGTSLTVVADQMQEAYIKNGVTTVQEGASSADQVKLLKRLSTIGALKVDVISYPTTECAREVFRKNPQLVRKYENHLKLGGYKYILDGAPQGRTAWMSEPYEAVSEGDDPDYCAFPWHTDEEMYQAALQAVTDGQQLLVHCNGDASSEQYLNAYEKVLSETGDTRDLRPVMIHCQTVRNDQLDRMAAIPMVASIFVGHVYYWGDVHLRNFGEKRANHISPVRDALDRGIVVNLHQDSPVTVPSMLHSIWVAVNRLTRSGRVLGADQRISVYEGLKAGTIGGAYQYFEEDSKGTIEPGKRADLVILDRSPLEVDPMEIRDIKVLETIKDGETIYQA